MEKEQRGHEAVYKSTKRIIIDNFFGGLAWGLGTVIGASVIVALLAYFFSHVNFIPIIGSGIAQIIDVINQNGKNYPLPR